MNGDGLLDLVCHFQARRTGFQLGDAAGSVCDKRLTQSIEVRPDFAVSLLVQAAALGHLDRIQEARGAVAKVMQMFPKLSLAKQERWTPIVRAEHRARYLEGLRKAGLPE